MAGMASVLQSSGATTRASTRKKKRSVLIEKVRAEQDGSAGETASKKAKVEFIPGVEETTVPDVRLTRSKDGTNGSAVFRFDNPDLFEYTNSDITGMFLTDEEGELSTTNVKARFVDGNPVGIQAQYNMRTPAEWDRFMRFMERYAEENDLGFRGSDSN